MLTKRDLKSGFAPICLATVLLASGQLTVVGQDALSAAAVPADAPDVNNPNYPRAGLCIYVGAGKGSLFTDLTANTTLLIHGLSVDDAALAATRMDSGTTGSRP